MASCLARDAGLVRGHRYCRGLDHRGSGFLCPGHGYGYWQADVIHVKKVDFARKIIYTVNNETTKVSFDPGKSKYYNQAKKAFSCPDDRGFFGFFLFRIL